MAHHNTILRQIVAFLPRHEFDALAKDHHLGQKFRYFSRWTQFMVMFVGHSGEFEKCRIDPNLDRLLRVSPPGISEIQGQNRPFHAADDSVAPAQSL